MERCGSTVAGDLAIIPTPLFGAVSRVPRVTIAAAHIEPLKESPPRSPLREDVAYQLAATG